jgi:hypothetical protein
MERRKVLALGGGLLSVTIAGCGGEETEFEEGNSGNGGGDGGTESDPDEALEILEHEMVRSDEGGPAEQVSIEGRAENVSDRRLSYAEVRARFYNEQGDQIESFIDNVNDLDSGSTWAFEIMYPGIGEDAQEVDSYDIGAGANF